MKVAIVGCGVMGAAAAWALSDRGHDVTIFEQFEVGHRRGSSHGQTRIYRYSYPDERYVEMMKEAIPLWRRLEEESGGAILRQTGGMDTGKDLDAHVAALEGQDIGYEMLDGRAVRSRWPNLRLPDEDILFQRDGGVVDADRAWHAFMASCLRRGTRLLERRRITELGRDGFDDFDVTVVTAGGWAGPLLATAGIELSVRPTRETVAYFRTREVFPTIVDWGDPSVYSLYDPVYGLKAGEHSAGPETDPDDEGVVNDASVARLQEWVADRYDGVDPVPVHVESCIYTNTPDRHFVIERHDGIVVGSACSGHGFKFAPLIGHRLADLVEA